MKFQLFTDMPFRLQYRVFLPAFAVLFLAAVFLVVRSYLRRRHGLGKKYTITLAVLRVLVLTLLFLCILKPVISGVSSGRELGRIAVFIDNSRSMLVEDGLGGASRRDTADWYLTGGGDMTRRMSRYFGIREYLFGDRLLEVRDRNGDAPEPSDSTDMGAVLVHVDKLQRGEGLLAGILLTDGNNNVGTDEALFGTRISAPVFTVGLGKKERGGEERADLAVKDILSKKVVLQKTTSPVNFALGKEGVLRKDVRVTVTDSDNSVVAEKVVELPDGDGDYSFTMDIIPGKKGIQRYKLSVPLVDGETITANNSRYFTVNVIDPQLNVLYYEGRPRYELKFIRRTLTESPNVHLYSIVRTSGDSYYVQGATPETQLRDGFPRTYDELKQFSVLMLGSGGTTVLAEDDIANIVRFVEDGKGLIVLGSEDLAGFAGTRMEEILPLRLAEGRAASDFTLAVTKEGRLHPLMEGYDKRFSEEPGLARFTGRVLTGTAKRGASVLARGDGSPVIAVQNYGKGRAMMITADNTWQWYMRCRKLGYDSLYERFWLQSIQWCAGFESVGKDKQFPIVFYTDRDYYDTGDGIRLEVQTSENIREISAVLKREGEQIDEIELIASGGGSNRYHASFALDDIAEYEVELSFQGESRSVKFAVGEKLREIVDTRLNEELLRRLSFASGGRYLDISERSELIESLRSLVVKGRETEKEMGIWDSPWLFAVFVVLIGSEWLLRRIRQLV